MSNFLPNSDAIEQPQERRYSTTRGWQTIRRWKGGSAAINAKALELQGAGYEFTVREGPVYEIEATIGADASSGGNQNDEPVDTWELSGNAYEKDLLQADIAAVYNMNAADYRLLRDFFDGKKSAEDYKTSSPSWVSAGSGDPESIWQLWLAGVKSIQMFQPILRHTKTVSRGTELPQSVTGAGQIYSTARLTSENAIPGWIIASLPSSATVNRPGESSALYYGWLKAYPQITVAAYGKSQIVQEWQYGLWATAIYTINT